MAAIGERRAPPRERIRRAYQRMTRYGALFGLRRRPAETPLEYARRLTGALVERRQGERTPGVLDPRRYIDAPSGEAEAIAAAYVRTRYSRQAVSAAERDRILEGWKRLRRQLPLLLLRRRRT